MSSHAEPISTAELWSGGKSPFGISYGKMMMWYFLVSDALTFGGLLTAYGVIRHGTAEAWPVGEQVFEALPFLHGKYPLIYVALMTFILIVSSVTMVLAVEAGHRNDKRGVTKWLGYTVLGGVFFLSSQAWEWSHFIHGSGGGFQLAHQVTVNTSSGRTLTLTEGTWVHMTSEFGHDFEHALAGHGATHEHADAHGDAHAAHGDAAHHEEAEHQHMDASAMVPSELIINKYVLTHDANGEDVRQEKVEGEEALKLWKSMSPNTMAFGANLHKNEYGPQQYADFFFFITGFHGFHVMQGVIINIIVWIMVMRGVFQRRGHYEMVEKIGLFWHFVDLVWVFVFTFYYLV